MGKPVYIHAIRTAVPANSLSQSEILAYMRTRQGLSPGEPSRLDGLYANSAIERRHSLIGDYNRTGSANCGVILSEEGQKAGTEARNQLFTDASFSGSIALAESFRGEALPAEGESLSVNCFNAGPGAGILSPQFDISGITHLITVSCTGFSSPGFDIHLQNELKLSGDLERFHIGFMGCYAAFPALRLANSICSSNGKAKVLIMAVEFCTLHFQDSDELDSHVANSLFSDGLGAMIISSEKSDSLRPLFKLNSTVSRLVGGGDEMMSWAIGDSGFKMSLSAYVPRIIETNINSIISSLCADARTAPESIGSWAIHPGGRAILDRIGKAMDIGADEMSESYDILRRYGNMSSPTIIFVLARIAADPGKKQEKKKIFAAAFGPGLTVEGAILTPVSRGKSKPEKGDFRYGVHRKKLPFLFPRTGSRMHLSEMMDREEVESGALFRTLEQFSFINRMLSPSRKMLNRHILKNLKGQPEDREIIIVDVGCGGGDILRWLDRKAARRGYRLRLIGIDPDERVAARARLMCSKHKSIEILSAGYGDIPELARSLGGIDYIISNHVLHHLDSSGIGNFIRTAAENAKKGIMLSDLRRSSLAYAGYTLFAALFLHRSLAFYDGRLSVLRGFTENELAGFCRLSGGNGKLEVLKPGPFYLVISGLV